MKITGIRCYQIDLPLKEGRYSWADGKYVEVFDSTVVVIETDSDIEGFADKPVLYQWQLIKMRSDEGHPLAPLIRLEVTILANPFNPYKFESFLNVAQDDQARVLDQLAGQDRLYLAFYGDGFNHRFTKIVNHDEQQWQYLDELVAEATDYWEGIPPEQRDFDQAKAAFMKRFETLS